MQPAVMQAPGLVQAAPAVFNQPYYRPVTTVRPIRPPPTQGYTNVSKYIYIYEKESRYNIVLSGCR